MHTNETNMEQQKQPTWSKEEGLSICRKGMTNLMMQSTTQLKS